MSQNHQIQRGETPNTRNFLVWAFVFSFVLHLAWMPVSIQETFSEWIGSEATQDEPIRITIRTEERKQIVNNTNTGLEVEPEDSKFLSEKNQLFKEQKVAKTVGSFQEAGKGVEDGREAEMAHSQAAAKPMVQQKERKNVKEKQASASKRVSLADLALEATELVQIEEQFESPFKALGIEDGAAMHTGLAKNNDFIEDLPLGDVTQLNTQEYMYYGFYHRIRQRLEQHWGNTLQEKAEYLFRSGRRLPANENMITALVVTMDHAGQIIDVKVKSTSGLNELDSAAIESFNRAGPFPNPPEGMIKNGRVQIEWGFVVKS